MFKKNIIIPLIIIASILLGACAVGASASDTLSENEDAKRTLSVSGNGKISLVPDLATISIGVHSENKNAVEAVASNTKQAQGVIDALKSFSIADKDIRTSNFSIYPRQDWGKEGERLGITYIVDNTVQVTVRDLDKIGKILDAVIQAGANNINGIQFDVSDRESAYQDALAAAVENAHARAETMAKAAGVDLDEVQTINSLVNIAQPPDLRMYAVKAESASTGEVPISAGEMIINVQVNMVYTLK
jgi:uncharacterized protein YggE